jgi:uncharacterized protein
MSQLIKIIRTANGYVHYYDRYLVPALIIVGFAGTYSGKKILFYLSEKQFKSIGLILVFIIGVATQLKQL